jgi:hypothetical protein
MTRFELPADVRARILERLWAADEVESLPELLEWLKTFVFVMRGLSETESRRLSASAAVALAACAIDAWERAHPGDRWTRPMLEAVRSWLACPCDEHMAACSRLHESSEDERAAADAAGDPLSEELVAAAIYGLFVGYVGELVERCAQVTPIETLHRALRSELRARLEDVEGSG